MRITSNDTTNERLFRTKALQNTLIILHRSHVSNESITNACPSFTILPGASVDCIIF
jgi:hypothetical protein